MSTRAIPPKGNGRGVSYPDFQDWRAQAKSFSSLAAYQGLTMNISDSGHPPGARQRRAGQRERIQPSSASVPILGRDFRDGEDRKGAEPVALLGYGLWKTRYGSDPNIVGRSIKINEVPTTVIGVMAEGMRFPNNTRPVASAGSRCRHGAPRRAAAEPVRPAAPGHDAQAGADGTDRHREAASSSSTRTRTRRSTPRS